jgi:hypothetical protein
MVQIRQYFTIIAFIMILLLLGPAEVLGFSGTEAQKWAVGWQFSRPASGLSVKCPLVKDYYLQPIFIVGLSDHEGTSNTTNKILAYGLRGIYNLSPQTDFHPYLGLGIGYNERYNSSPAHDPSTRGGTGCEAFFGFEYDKYPLRPSLELSLGGFKRIEGGYRAGITCNISVFYYF